jgi:hypothetical protein
MIFVRHLKPTWHTCYRAAAIALMGNCEQFAMITVRLFLT